MRVNIKHLFLAAFIALTLLAHSAFAQDTSFRSVQLAYGISLDVPSHWTVLSLENRKNLGAAGQAMTDNAGIEGSSGRKESLLAMNATPNPTGAMIRVSVTSPPDYTQSDLAAATPADLQEVGTEMLKMFRQLEASGGPKIIEMQPVRIERLNNYRVLVMPYIRAGVNAGRDYTFCEQFASVVTPKNISIRKSSLQQAHLIFRRLLIDFG